eukprot:2348612-Rhodomonas_salina.1
MNKAFYLGQNYKSTPSPAATATTGTTLQASKEGGKPNWRNVCPTCKITHPEGIKSCPHWESTTKATIERNKAKREAAREANPRQHKKGRKSDKEKVLDAAPNDQLPGIGGEDAHAFLANADQ